MNLTLNNIAEQLGARLSVQSDVEITGIAGIDHAEAGQISFISNKKYTSFISSTRASAVVVDKQFKSENHDIPLLIVDNVYFSLAKLLSLFDPRNQDNFFRSSDKNHIDASATLGENVLVGAFSVIDANVEIGSDTRILSQVSIGKNVKIGSNCLIYPGVKIYHDCVIGDNVIIQANAIIGSDGFGFAPM